METNEVMIDIGKPEDENQPKKDDNGARFGILFNINRTAEYQSHSVRYNLRKEILKLKTIGAAVEFKVGKRPINNFSMVERHFFRNKLLKSFVFEFGFIIPDSVNSAEHIYEVYYSSISTLATVKYSRCQSLIRSC